MKDSERTKQNILLVLGILIFIVAVGGITFAFFNYTRTGSENTLRLGNIEFTGNSTYVSLSNVFPVRSSQVDLDQSNVVTSVVTITGKTSYVGGIEYLVSLVDVQNSFAGTNIPIALSVTTSGLGSADSSYFTNRGSTKTYKILAGTTLYDDEYIFVGYIPTDATNTTTGTVTIKAYIDADEVAISDTYDGLETDLMGTTSDWVDGRTVLTTSEWNGLRTNGISFKVRVEANEGVWVPNPTTANDLDKTKFAAISNKSSITEVRFVRLSEEMINTHTTLTDLSGTNGTVKGWVEDNKLYVASAGTTVFPVDSSSLFDGFTAVTRYAFNNVDTSSVEDMSGMFSGNAALTTVDFSTFNTASVEDMSEMFMGCSNLVILNLSSFNTGAVTDMSGMFKNCSSLENLRINSFDTEDVTDMSEMFMGCTSLVTLDLSSFDTSSADDVSSMFEMPASPATNALTTIRVGSDWDVSGATTSTDMFLNCTEIVGGAGTVYDSTNVDNAYAVVDGGTGSEGYLTAA